MTLGAGRKIHLHVVMNDWFVLFSPLFTRLGYRSLNRFILKFKIRIEMVKKLTLLGLFDSENQRDEYYVLIVVHVSAQYD